MPFSTAGVAEMLPAVASFHFFTSLGAPPTPMVLSLVLLVLLRSWPLFSQLPPAAKAADAVNSTPAAHPATPTRRRRLHRRERSTAGVGLVYGMVQFLPSDAPGPESCREGH